MQIEKRTNSPEIDKEVSDSTSLKPVLLDFRAAHPNLKYSVFAADAAFDSHDNFRFLLKDYGFTKAVIPTRRECAPPTDFNKYGTPLCPKDGSPFVFHSKCGGRYRSARLKFVCPKAVPIRTESGGTTMRCTCATPCSDSSYGKCVYVYPDRNLRLYPGLPLDSEEFTTIYNRRASVERSISALKDTLGLSNRKTSNVLTTKADLFLSGIVQLLCVLLAKKFHDPKLARRPRRLIA